MYYNLNNQIVQSIESISPLNRSFRYGDGFFESILYHHHAIPLWKYHYQRLVTTIQFLFGESIAVPTDIDLQIAIHELCKVNQLSNAKVRITFWRKGGGTYRALENEFDYLIEASMLDIKPLQDEMISVGFYDEVKKPTIRLSNFKTNSSIYFVMAQRYARQQQLDEVILFNTKNRVCEGSYQNIFYAKDEMFYTPALTEGCIDGAARRYLLDYFKSKNIVCKETKVSQEDIENADIVFFSTGLRILTLAKNDKSGRMLKIRKELKALLNIV